MGETLSCLPMDTLIPATSEMLVDIVNNVQILDINCIKHPQYPPWKLSDLLGDRFTQLTPLLQHKYLSLQLRDFIHSIYFSGESQSLSVAAAQLPTLPHSPIADRCIENNLSRGIHRSFYDKLHSSNCGTGYADTGWLVLSQLAADRFIVQKQRLTLLVDHPSDLLEPIVTIQVGDQITLKLPRNRLEDRFYVAIGNAGDVNQVVTAISFYFHIDADGAIALMTAITQQLNALSIPFRFSVLYDTSEYSRYDAGVLSVPASQYALIAPILAQIYQASSSHFQTAVPLFTKPIAPGLGLAEVPLPNQATNQDFGLNRCQLVANGLLQTSTDRNFSDRLAAIRDQFEPLGINWTKPYLNPQSNALYELPLL